MPTESEIKITVTADNTGTQVTKEQLQSLVEQIRRLDLETRQGAIKSTEEFDARLKNLVDTANSYRLSLKQANDIEGKFLQVQGHFNSGFSTMSESLSGINYNARTANVTLRRVAETIQYMAVSPRMAGVEFDRLAREITILATNTGGFGNAWQLIMSQLRSPSGLLVIGTAIATIATVTLPSLFGGLSKTREEEKRHEEELQRLAQKTEEANRQFASLEEQLKETFPGDKRTISIILDIKKSYQTEIDEIDARLKDMANKPSAIFGIETEKGKLERRRATLIELQNQDNEELKQHAQFVKQFLEISQLPKGKTFVEQLVTSGGYSISELDALQQALERQRKQFGINTPEFVKYDKAVKLLASSLEQFNTKKETKDTTAELVILQAKNAGYEGDAYNNALKTLTALKAQTTDTLEREKLQEKLNQLIKEHTDVEKKSEDDIKKTFSDKISLIEQYNKAYEITDEQAIQQLENLKKQVTIISDVKEQEKLRLAIEILISQYQDKIEKNAEKEAADAEKLQQQTFQHYYSIANATYFEPMRAAFGDLLNQTQQYAFGGAEAMKRAFGEAGAAIIQSLEAVIVKLAEVAAEALILNAITGGTASFGETFLSLLGITPKPEGKASGGEVYSNRPYFVGERGMELFIPRISGTIIPNHNLTTINRISQASHYSNSMVTIHPAVSVHPIVNNQGLAVQVAIGNQILSKRQARWG